MKAILLLVNIVLYPFNRRVMRIKTYSKKNERFGGSSFSPRLYIGIPATKSKTTYIMRTAR